MLLALAAAFDPSLARLQEEDGRLARIAWRLQTANVALCPQTTRLTGLSVHALSQYRRGQQRAATAQFGLTDRPGIAAVAPESAAARAGLRPGDVLLAVDGVATPTVRPTAGYAPVAATEAMLDAAMAQAPAELRIARRGQEQTVALPGETGCASRVQIIAGTGLNARADGRYVQIYAPMLDFAANDDELATVVGHELAHNILRHVQRGVPGKVAEYEADRLGAWLVARAGYNVDAVVPFWTRYEKQTNPGIFADGTHPSLKARLAAITQAVHVLKAQRAAGQALIPPPQ